MIDDLMEVSRADVGKLNVEPRPIDVSDVVNDAALTLSQRAVARGVSLITEVPGDLPTANADPNRVLQVLLNLIDNSLKFTPEGGRVCVRATCAPDAPDVLRLSVEDTGCGISAEGCAKIFDRLHQEAGSTDASRKGLGLGLYLCKELVARHGGRIWAESELGAGTTIHFTLPIFSLVNLVGSVIAPDGRLRPIVALVAIDVSSAGSLVGDALEPHLRSARRVVRHCILPDLDVLLPEMARRPNGDTLLVVAATDRNGVSVLSRRIQNQLERSTDFDSAQTVVRLSTTVFETPPDGDGASTPGLELVSRRISRWITELKEKISDEEEADLDR
jgi:hypothetical protein